jgi:hypothetical protein
MKDSVINPREALVEMERVLTRRSLFGKLAKGVGVAAAWDRFGGKLFGQTIATVFPALITQAQLIAQALPVVSAFGQMVVPVDDVPGWATFEPDITTYTLDVYIRQVFYLANDLAFNGYLTALVGFNNLPPTVSYGPTFLNMDLATRGQYLIDVLEGNFENDGTQDVMAFGAIYMLLGTKMVFFQNYPHQMADPTAEFQQILGNTPPTAFDFMGYRGPVGPAEEIALRAAAANAPELPGIDPNDPYM